MRFKRRLLMLLLSATMLFSSVMVAHAAYGTGAGSTTVYSKEFDMSLYGYIDFVEGVLWFRDDYLYNISFAGDEVYLIPYPDENVYVNVKSVTDNDGFLEYITIKELSPYYGRTYLSSTTTYGYGATYAMLSIKCYDKTGSVIGK